MKQRNDQPVWVWILIAAMGIVALTALTGLVRADTKVEVFGGHWGHHWFSQDITNERHALVCLRVDWAVGCRFDNSYKSEDFSGESYALGLVKDWTLASNINRWGGDIEVMGSIGATYGYTEFAGHDPSKDKGVHGYIAPALYYRQPFDDTAYWKAGILQFGDDSILSAGVGVRF